MMRGSEQASGVTWSRGVSSRRAAGFLGVGESSGQLTTGQPLGLANMTSVHTAGSHTCGVDTSGDVWCWGANAHHQLGDGTTDFADEPQRVPGLAPAQGGWTGTQHTCAVVDGRLYCWGENDDGQAGDPSAAAHVEMPRLVEGITGVRSAILQASGTCAVTDTETVCFGRGFFGGDTANRDPAARIRVDFPDAPAQVVGGLSHLCARIEGDVFCLGDNLSGPLGVSDFFAPTPVRVPLDEPATEIVAGPNATCARTASGFVCWGMDDFGQLGSQSTGSFRGRLQPAPEFAGAHQLALGYESSCAWYDSGVLQCVGRNHLGQLGDGTTMSRLTAEPEVFD